MVTGQRGSKQMAQLSSEGEEEEEDEELAEDSPDCLALLRLHFLKLSIFVYW